MTHRGPAVLLLALLLGAAAAAESQGRPPPGMGPGRMGRGGCLELEQLDLSEKQRAVVREAEARFRPAIDDLRNRLMAHRMEFEGLLRNPEVPTGEIRRKGEEISTLRERLASELLNHGLELRAALTPAQIRQWCPPPPAGGGMGRRRWMEP
jgi:Spy/CpxP family protein refolding chaperone